MACPTPPQLPRGNLYGFGNGSCLPTLRPTSSRLGNRYRLGTVLYEHSLYATLTNGIDRTTLTPPDRLVSAWWNSTTMRFPCLTISSSILCMVLRAPAFSGSASFSRTIEFRSFARWISYAAGFVWALNTIPANRIHEAACAATGSEGHTGDGRETQSMAWASTFPT